MPAPTQPFFEYEPLPNSSTDLRLLQLLPEKKDGLLQFNLFANSLSCAPSYHALSYEWGQPNDNERIIVNGSVFVVQQNLHLFLEQIHRHYTPQLPMNLWVDAVCIDQHGQGSENEEKNNQTAIMDRIYSMADMVLMWIGKADYLEFPFTFLLSYWHRAQFPLEETYTEVDQGIQFNIHWREAGQRLFYTMINNTETTAARFLRNQLLRMLTSFLHEPYWSRLWIFQELVSARKCTLFSHTTRPNPEDLHKVLDHGELYRIWLFVTGIQEGYRGLYDQLTMRSFEHFYSSGVADKIDDRSGPYASQTREFFQTAITNYQGTADLWETGGSREEIERRMEELMHDYFLLFEAKIDRTLKVAVRPSDETDLTLQELIMEHAGSECTDKHVKVYGLLGIANDVTEASPFPVNYSSSLVDLLIESLIWCKSTQSLKFAVTLVRALGFRSQYLRNATNTFEECNEWARDFLHSWKSQEAAKLATRVMVGGLTPHDVDDGPLIRIEFKHDTPSVDRMDPITAIYKKANHQFVLVDVKIPPDADQLSSSSDVLISVGVLQETSQPRITREMKHLERWEIDMTIQDLLYIITITMHHAMILDIDPYNRSRIRNGQWEDDIREILGLPKTGRFTKIRAGYSRLDQQCGEVLGNIMSPESQGLSTMFLVGTGILVGLIWMLRGVKGEC